MNGSVGGPSNHQSPTILLLIWRCGLTTRHISRAMAIMKPSIHQIADHGQYREAKNESLHDFVASRTAQGMDVLKRTMLSTAPYGSSTHEMRGIPSIKVLDDGRAAGLPYLIGLTPCMQRPA